MDRQSLLKILLVGLVVSALAWLYASGTYERFDPDSMRVWIRDAGGWGAALFVISYSCMQPLGVPGLVFLLTAPLIWSPTEAFLLNWLGTAGTGLFSFAAARFIIRDWVQTRLPARVRRFDDRLHSRGFMTVLLLRAVFYTSPSVQYALGVSRVRFGPFLLGTILGVAPFTLLMTLLGIRINAWLDKHPISSWPWAQIGPLIVLGAVLLAAVATLALRRWRARTVE